MNVLDLIIGIILILFAIYGLRRGLIVEAFYLASFIIGAYGAMYFSDVVAGWLSGFVDVGMKYIAVIAFVITFVIFVVLIRILGHAISRLVEAIHLGVLDRIGGFFFGVMKGALVVSVIIMIMNIFGISSLINSNTRKGSILYTYTESIANKLYRNHVVIRGSVCELLDNNIETVENVEETI